ncbi:MAG: hypothetical protein HC879_00790 [Leptolyngbyaceae cyanobacterium SL_5_9]|nr:hypothetical protein [Leptolyngbyaceae cyanobacterium SL_5_9]
MNQKSVLLLSGASVVLLTSPAIATQPTEAIPDSASAIETNSPTPEPVVVEVQAVPPEQVALPEQIVEALAPAPIPPVSPPEPFAPDFSAPPPPVVEAIAPTPEQLEKKSESAPANAEVVSAPLEQPPEPVENFDQPIPSAVPEASEPSDDLPNELPIEASEASDDGLADELPQRSHDLENTLPSELPQRSHDLDHEQPDELNESNHELPNALNQAEHELSKDSPHLYGEPEPEADLIERLAQDDLDQLSPDEWIDLLWSEESEAHDTLEENTAEHLENSFTNSAAVPEPIQQAEFSQTQLDAIQPSLTRDTSVEADPRLPQLNEPQPSEPQPVTPVAPARVTSTGADSRSAPGFDHETETGSLQYRLVVGDRLVFDVKPYRLNWAANDPDSIRKQKMRRSPESNSPLKTGIHAGVGFNLQISDRAQFQFAYGDQNAPDPQSKTASSVQPAAETSPSQDATFNKPTKTDSLIESDQVETVEPLEDSDPSGSNALTNLAEHYLEEEWIKPMEAGDPVGRSPPASLPSPLPMRSRQPRPLLSKRKRPALQISLNPSTASTAPLSGALPPPLS